VLWEIIFILELQFAETQETILKKKVIRCTIKQKNKNFTAENCSIFEKLVK